MTTRTLFLLLIMSATLSPAAEVTRIHKLTPDETTARLERDAREVLLHRDGLRDVIRYVETRADLFPAERPNPSRLLRREQKEDVWNTWQRFLDYMMALDSIEKYHADFYRLKGAAMEDSFLIGYAAMLAKYRAGLELIDRAEHDPELDKVLNDPVPELGLPPGTYSRLKFKYLNVAIATDFAARELVLKTFSGGRQTALRGAIGSDAGHIWKAGRGRGELLTLRNAVKIVQNGAQSAWLPVQAGVSGWMGDTRVHRAGQSLILPAQIRNLQPALQPGDILLERREWYLSNIGLPGFWSHAALYIGTAEERRAFFADDAAMRSWVMEQGAPDGDLETLLQMRYPAAHQQSGLPREAGNPVRILEAIGEGVSFTSLEHSADCDSLAVLRPRLTKAEKARALVRAFLYAGRPYDFDFDFATDSALVCTELVYKAYEPATGFKGLTFPLVEMLGRKVTPANELVKQFDAAHGKPDQQCDLIIFLDGQERRARATESGLEEFRASWKRPKWHVLVSK